MNSFRTCTGAARSLLAVAACVAARAGCQQQTGGLPGSSSIPDASAASTGEIAAALERDGRVIPRGVLFGFYGDAPSPSGEAAFARLAEAMACNPALRVAVVGHTDSTGDFEDNPGPSERRAASMARAVEAAGVASDRVVFVGVGSIAPVAGNETEDGHARNRRVEAVVTG